MRTIWPQSLLRRIDMRLLDVPARKLEDAILSLPTRIQTILLSRFRYGHSLKDVCAEVDLSVRQVQRLQRTGYEILRRNLLFDPAVSTFSPLRCASHAELANIPVDELPLSLKASAVLHDCNVVTTFDLIQSVASICANRRVPTRVSNELKDISALIIFAVADNQIERPHGTTVQSVRCCCWETQQVFRSFSEADLYMGWPRGTASRIADSGKPYEGKTIVTRKRIVRRNSRELFKLEN